jgi:hypothetical protein
MSESCCAAPAKKTKQEFLIEKAKNFRTWLLTYECDDDVKNYVNMFDETLLVPTIQMILVPLVKKGGIPSASKDLAKKVKVPEKDLEAFCDKFRRYCEMFVELINGV